MSLGSSSALLKAAKLGSVGAAALLAAGGGGAALAQCTTNNPAIVQLAPFARASLVNSIVTTLSTVQLGSLAQSTAFVGSPANPQPDQQGAGSWSRVVGGSTETHAKSTADISTRAVEFLGVPIAGIPATGRVECNTTAQQDFITSQFGFDIARHNFAGGGNIHIGVTGGYSDVGTRDKTPSTPDIVDGGFKADTQIPFAGVYASVYAGNFSFDAQARFDWLRSQFTDTSIAAFNQHHDARSFAFLWNAAYRFSLPQNWFIEPSIGGVWSRTEVDDLSVAGTYSTGNINGTSPGFLRIDDVASLTGRASIRIGTVITTGNLALQPFVVGSVFHEFAGNVRSTFEGDDRRAGYVGGATTLFANNGTITTSRVGTYGHVGVGLAGTIINTGWLGYARFDYRSGDNIDGYSFNAGMRYQFVPPRMVGAMSVKDGPAPAAHGSGYDWTGLYLGYFSGVVRADNDMVFVASGLGTSPDPAGYLLGGQVGANWQTGRLVLGIEADYGFSNAKGGQACPNDVFFTCTARIDSLGLVTGRVGLTAGRALFFAKAGVAFADVEAGFLPNGNLPFVRANLSRAMTGLAVGAGVEFAITDNWSAKAEYVHFDFGRERFELGGNTFTTDISGDSVRVGMNYHFGKRRVDPEPLK